MPTATRQQQVKAYFLTAMWGWSKTKQVLSRKLNLINIQVVTNFQLLSKLLFAKKSDI